MTTKKNAGDIVNFPDKWEGKDPQHGSDLIIMTDRVADRMKALISFIDQGLESSTGHKFLTEVEDALVNYVASVFKIEEDLKKHMENEDLNKGEVLNLSGDE